MANSFDQFTGTGSQTDYVLSFPYLLQSHVKVYEDGVENTDFSFITSNTIQMDTAPALNVQVKITRETNQTNILTDFEDGTNLVENDLDTATLQNFYLIQEALDAIGLFGVANLATAGHILIGDGTDFINNAVTGDISLSTTGVTAIVAGAIVDADVNASAAIAYSKLNLTGAVLSADLAGSIDATKIADGTVTDTEFQYIGTLTSDVQTQINNIVAGAVGNTLDTDFRILDDGDNTKKIAFQASSITTGTTRTITMPDEDVTLGALKDEDDMSSNSAVHPASQQSIKAYVDSGTATMSNKTLTAPVINDPTFDVSVGNTANTNSSQGDNPITSFFYEVATCANAGDAVTLPTATAGLMVIIANNGANSCDVFPASGDSIDGESVNVAKALASGTNTVFICQDGTDWDTVSGGGGTTNATVDTMTGDGSTTTLALSESPGSVNNVMVFIDGVNQKPTTDYTLSGSTITFIVAPPNGTSVVAFSGTTSTIGTPSDGTVTNAKVAAGAAIATTKLGAGAIVQVQNSQSVAVGTTTNTCGNDDSLPLISETGSITTVSITPTNASNILIVTGTAFLSSAAGAGNYLVLGISNTDLDATNCVAAKMSYAALSTEPADITVVYKVVAGTTSSTTFDLRMSNNQNTTTVNGWSGGRILGGAATSSITVMEIQV